VKENWQAAKYKNEQQPANQVPGRYRCFSIRAELKNKNSRL
jgi:hypothetical protein